MTIDRAAWADSYRFHAEALEKLGQMRQDPFWEWVAARMIEISNAHGNRTIIMGLLIAVFEDLEAADKAARDRAA